MNKTLLATMIGLAVLTGCERSDNKNTVYNPPTEAEAFSSPYSISFEGTGEGALEGPVNFTLQGAKSDLDTLEVTNATRTDTAASARNDVEQEERSYQTDTGGFILSRKEGANAEEIELQLVVFRDGYWTSGNTIVIPAEVDITDEGAGFQIITLTSQKPETDQVAVTATEGSGETDEEGAVIEEIKVQTPVPEEGDSNAEAVAGGSVELTIPPATVMRGRNQEVITGPLTANMVYFSNEPNGNGELFESSLQAFPGGLSPAEIIASGDTEEPDPDLSGGTFISAGFAAIEIKNDQNEVVSEFSDPVPLTFRVSGDTKDPDGKNIETGDVIPLWSYDELTGKWKDEDQEVEVGDYDETTNTFEVTALISHLSYYNLDYWNQNCTINFSTTGVDLNNFQVEAKLTRDGGGWSPGLLPLWGSSHKLIGVPAGSDGRLEIMRFRSGNAESIIEKAVDKDGDPITVSGGAITGSFCNLDGATLTLKPEPSTDVSLLMSLQSQCSDTDEYVDQPGVVDIDKILFGIPYRMISFNVQKGIPAINLLEPGTYRISGTLQGDIKGDSTATDTITLAAGQSSYEYILPFDAGICGTPGGGTGGTGGSGGSGSSGGGGGN
ncbi:hypothetical protein [Vibrio sp. WXL103]|uniref:hypothetical protein n=1 Tax=Vibrio sp. WXL103 TaxID=3450710 RepID=UPI003EC6EF0B